MIRLGLDRLTTWWSAVELRPRLEVTSANQLHGQLKQIDYVIAALSAQGSPDELLIGHCRMVSEHLATRLEKYRAQLSV